MYLLLDFWVDTRVKEEHPLGFLEMEMHANPVIFDREEQIKLLGEDHFKTGDEPMILNRIGITPGIGRRAPRLYTRNGLVSRERGQAFLNYLKHSGVGEMSPKHTALYFHDENSEVLGHVLPPIQVKRHVLDRWIRLYHQYMFNRAHTCIGHPEDVGEKVKNPSRNKKKTDEKELSKREKKKLRKKKQPRWEFYGGKKRNHYHFDTVKKHFVAQAGHDPKMVPFEAIGHMSGRPLVLGGEKYADVQGNIKMADVDAKRAEFCFHRIPHDCQRCCALEPAQELFAARSTDQQFVVRLLSSNTQAICCWSQIYNDLF